MVFSASKGPYSVAATSSNTAVMQNADVTFVAGPSNAFTRQVQIKLQANAPIGQSTDITLTVTDSLGVQGPGSKFRVVVLGEPSVLYAATRPRSRVS